MQPKTILLLAFSAFTGLFFSGCGKIANVSNKAPVADAGPSKVITLPTNSVTLTGTGTDADGTIASYFWSQVSGPAATSITNPGSPSTPITGFVAGTYVFQLTVTDNGGLPGTDTVSVLVNPAPAPTTFTAQPANNTTERMLINVGTTDKSASGVDHWTIDAWTSNSLPYTGRVIFKFDLSSIPATATITGATLYLYSNSPPVEGNLVDANFGTNNSLVLQQITSSWVPASANWNNQPPTTTTNQVLIPATTQSVLDFTADVTQMVKSMVSTNANYGFMLKLQSEVMYNSREIVSSFNTAKAAKYPKLVVTYTP